MRDVRIFDYGTEGRIEREGGGKFYGFGICGEEMYFNGEVIGVMQFTTAIIELPDGGLENINLPNIQFVDNFGDAQKRIDDNVNTISKSGKKEIVK